MSTLRRFLTAKPVRDDRGSVAMMFGLMTTVLVMFSGLALDYGRIVDLRGRMVDAADSATLAAGKAMLAGELSDTEIIELARTFFVQNLGPLSEATTLGDPDIRINRTTGDVAISVVANLGMTLARVAGYKSMQVPITSEANFRQKDIEVGMALDITGSMRERMGGQTKIASLEDAFEIFANRLLPDERSTANRVRIALAPYSASVNVGRDSGTISNFMSSDDCVVEAVGGRASDSLNVFNVINRRVGRAIGYSCPSNSIMPLTDDREALIREVRSFNPIGGTAGHLGAQWAWNLVSDKWTGVFSGSHAPDGYDRVERNELLKAVVLMTDGDFNTSYTGPSSPAQAVALCNSMKAKGVKVFSIAFGLTRGSPSEATLRNCASEGDEYFALADSPEELNAAFEKFADQLTQLRLVK